MVWKWLKYMINMYNMYKCMIIGLGMINLYNEI